MVLDLKDCYKNNLKLTKLGINMKSLNSKTNKRQFQSS